jgi:RHS repeat-associated protein
LKCDDPVGVTTPIDTWSYRYDAFGNRIATTHNGVTTNYVIDPTGLGNLAAEYNSSGNLIARYDYGYGLLDRTDTGGASDYYTFSAIGNTSELTDLVGTVVDSYAYDPFGSILSKRGTVDNLFEFAGEYGVVNQSTNFLFMRARMYSVQDGRFTSTDPAGPFDEINLYNYSNNMTTSIADPSGRFWQIIIPALRGIVWVTLGS